ncbi:hypothetical protein M513_10193, partial [Trichuris suis]
MSHKKISTRQETASCRLLSKWSITCQKSNYIGQHCSGATDARLVSSSDHASGQISIHVTKTGKAMTEDKYENSTSRYKTPSILQNMSTVISLSHNKFITAAFKAKE